MISLSHKHRHQAPGYTLTELLVSMGILALILALTTNMVSGTQKSLRTARAAADQFRSARQAFDVLTRNLQQTTLNTYWDYDNPEDPSLFLRQSELHFVSGPAGPVLDDTKIYGHSIFFTAPFGFAGSDATGDDPATDSYRDMETLLNAWGYYVAYNEDDDAPPFIKALQPDTISVKGGFRLMEFRQPSEELAIYKQDLRIASYKNNAYSWFRDHYKDNSRVVAENIIAMIIRPVVSASDAEAKNEDPWWIAPDYLYDSRGKQLSTMTGKAAEASANQVPPVLELTLVAVEEKSYRSFERTTNGNAESQVGGLVQGLFHDADDFAEDLESLSEGLRDLNIEFRVFQASVGLRTAKWSD